jgi:hypothetical protein
MRDASPLNRSVESHVRRWSQVDARAFVQVLL